MRGGAMNSRAMKFLAAFFLVSLPVEGFFISSPIMLELERPVLSQFGSWLVVMPLIALGVMLFFRKIGFTPSSRDVRIQQGGFLFLIFGIGGVLACASGFLGMLYFGFSGDAVILSTSLGVLGLCLGFLYFKE